MIIASALKITKDEKEFVVMGKRHGDCAETLYKAGVVRPFECVEGFVNDQFEFLDRFQAWDEAECNAQIMPYPDYDTPSPGMLFSEDLW